LRNLTRISVIAAAFLLGASNAWAAPIRISGPYAKRLSEDDIQQIRTLVSKERGVDHRLKKIEAVSPEKVRIQTGGRTAVDSDTYYDFSAHKRAGGWTIDPNSIEISIETRVQPNNGQILIR
jgi:hypothetical protein